MQLSSERKWLAWRCSIPDATIKPGGLSPELAKPQSISINPGSASAFLPLLMLARMRFRVRRECFCLSTSFVTCYRPSMIRVGKKSRSFQEAEQWNLQQYREMSPNERIAVVRALQRKVFGPNTPDVRACHQAAK